MATTQMLKSSAIDVNGRATMVLSYSDEPQIFSYSVSDNYLTIAEPTRNSLIHFPNLPTLNGDLIFKISDSNGRLTGMFAGLTSNSETYICSFGSIKVYAWFAGESTLTLKFKNNNNDDIAYWNISYVYPSTSSSTGSRNAFFIFLPVEYNNTQYLLPYTIESNPYWFGHQASQQYNMSNVTPIHVYSQDPYDTAPDSEPDGGYGDYDYDGDDIPFPTLPAWSIVDSGFVTLYKPSISQIKSLAQYLWTGIFDLATYKKIFADPMDCIISLSRVPIDAPATGSQVLSVGNISTGLTFDVLSSQFVEVNFVSKNIGLRANGFLDYAPYVKVQIYLPFIGMRALSIDDIAGKSISLKYQIDLFTGACTAYLKCSITNSDGNTVDSVLYQYSGNVLANIPITQANYDSFINSVITAAAKTGSALISGGAAAAAGAAISSGINVAANIKPDVERSGNMTATSGFLGVKKPYLILTYPNVCKPRNREKTVSIPSFIGLGIQSDNSNLKLSNFKGLTILHKINVKNIPCTEIERQMIESQLTTEGVIL